MKAAICYQPGGPEVFRYEEVPDPELAADGVLVRAEAISVEGGDTLHRARGEVPPGPHIVGYQRPTPTSKTARHSDVSCSSHEHELPDARDRLPRRVARFSAAEARRFRSGRNGLPITAIRQRAGAMMPSHHVERR